MSNIQINVRDENVKKTAQAIFKRLGMDMTTAINIFLVQVSLENGLPFPVRLDDAISENGFTKSVERSVILASQEAKKGENITACDTEEDVQSHLDSLK